MAVHYASSPFMRFWDGTAYTLEGDGEIGFNADGGTFLLPGPSARVPRITTDQAGTVVKWIMRAWHTTTSQYVYWSSSDGPDPTGQKAPVPASELQDIVTLGS